MHACMHASFQIGDHFTTRNKVFRHL